MYKVHWRSKKHKQVNKNDLHIYISSTAVDPRSMEHIMFYTFFQLLSQVTGHNKNETSIQSPDGPSDPEQFSLP